MAAGITWFVHPGQMLVRHGIAPLVREGALTTSVGLLAVVGFVMLTDLLYEALRKAEHTDLFLIFWILIPLPIVYYAHLPSKYVLPCMPAVILLSYRLMAGFSVQ